MYCTNCGKQIPDSARVCGFCGFQQGAAFQQPYQIPYQQPAPIIVQTSHPGGILSGCGNVFNLILTVALLAVIGVIVLSFLCVIRLPAAFPLFNPPAPVAALWSNAVAWQGDSCGSRAAPPAGNPAPAANIDGGNAQGENAGATACNRSKFVSETIPDHTVFKPGEKFSKTWTVRNEGDCAWTTAYTFRFTQGAQLGGPKSLALANGVQPGDTYTFKLGLTAPDKAGTYTGRWEIFDDQGSSFGWYSVVIDVGAEGVAPKQKEATVIVTPSNAPVGTVFSAAFSGYTPNSSIKVTVKSLDSGWTYNDFTINSDGKGKSAASFGSAEFEPGQYVITGTGNGVTGSAVIIVEKNKCSEAKTQADCEAAGGEWAVIRMDPGPNQYYCNCP